MIFELSKLFLLFMLVRFKVSIGVKKDFIKCKLIFKGFHLALIMFFEVAV